MPVLLRKKWPFLSLCWKRNNQMFLTQYKNALKDIKKYLQSDLKYLDFQAAQIYGSSTYAWGFKEGI